MNVLVVAPHPDDEALGCGGTIRSHVDGGDRVVVAFLTSGEGGLASYPADRARRVREREAAKASEVLGVAAHVFVRLADGCVTENLTAATAALDDIVQAERPDVVYAPHESDGHDDHAAAYAAAAAAASDGELLTYEIWTPLTTFERVEDITDQMPAKLRAVRSYRSQVRYWRYDLAIKGLNAYRGAMVAGTRYAEVFGVRAGRGGR